MTYNQEAFTPEEVEQGLHLDLLNCLLDYNKKAEKTFKDIHIWSDGYCLCIDWTTRYYDGMPSGEFEYIDEDEIKMLIRRFPDDSFGYFETEEDYQKELNNWLKKNPGWSKDKHGIWRHQED